MVVFLLELHYNILYWLFKQQNKIIIYIFKKNYITYFSIITVIQITSIIILVIISIIIIIIKILQSYNHLLLFN